MRDIIMTAGLGLAAAFLLLSSQAFAHTTGAPHDHSTWVELSDFALFYIGLLLMAALFLIKQGRRNKVRRR